MASELPTAPSPRSTSLASGIRFRLSVMMFLQFFIWGAWFELGFDYIPKLGFNGNWQLPLIFGAFNVGALVALFFSTQFADRRFAAEKFLAFSHLIGGVAILGLYFLPGKVGNQAGQYLMTVHITGPGSKVGEGIGKGPGGSTIIVDGLEDEWDQVTDADVKKRPTVTARITSVESTSSGPVPNKAVKETIAPFWPFFFLMLMHSLFYVPTISITNSIAFANLTEPARQFGPVPRLGDDRLDRGVVAIHLYSD